MIVGVGAARVRDVFEQAVRRRAVDHLTIICQSRPTRVYLHSQSLLFVFPSASALYSKTTATAFRRRKFGESL
jgi:hypothetical protein